MNIIEITSLQKTYPGALEPTLKGISLQMPSNSIFGLLGPNGAGKTTSISIMVGLVKPDAGTVLMMGMDVMRQMEKIKRCLGIVPQDIALFPILTARENLHYFGRLYGLKGSELKDKVQHYLQLFGLENNADKRVLNYSGGMKRRCNLIAGILHDPKLLILDEPTVGVDVQSRKMIIDFLLEFKSKGGSILYTSHLLDEAQEICDEVAIMDYGQILSRGKTADLLTQEGHSLEKLFLELTGHHVRD
jgi:ABC-2 type transport system ATP-binding protein